MLKLTPQKGHHYIVSIPLNVRYDFIYIYTYRSYYLWDYLWNFFLLLSKNQVFRQNLKLSKYQQQALSKIWFYLDPIQIESILTVRSLVRFRRHGIVKVQTLKLRVSICSEVRWLMNKSPFELVKLYFQIYTKNVLHYNLAFFGQLFYSIVHEIVPCES